MKKTLMISLAGLLVLVAAGCTTRLGSFTVISTRNVEWNRAGEYIRSGERIEGTDVMHIILFISTQASIDMQTAVDDALDQIPGAVALIDTVLSIRSWSVLVYGQTAYIVTGTALVDPVIAGTIVEGERTSGGEDLYALFSYNDDGILEKHMISAEEYAEYAGTI
jgi:hypothetical protein